MKMNEQVTITLKLSDRERNDIVDELELFELEEMLTPMLTNVLNILQHDTPPKTPKGKKGRNKEQGRYPNYNRIDD